MTSSLTHWGYFNFWLTKRDPRDLRPLRTLISEMTWPKRPSYQQTNPHTNQCFHTDVFPWYNVKNDIVSFVLLLIFTTIIGNSIVGTFIVIIIPLFLKKLPNASSAAASMCRRVKKPNKNRHSPLFTKRRLNPYLSNPGVLGVQSMDPILSN